MRCFDRQLWHFEAELGGGGHLINQISIQLNADARDTYDQFRVITAVPLPAAAWLFGSAVLGFISMRRKQTLSISV